MESTLFDIGIVLAVASSFALVARVLRQPLIIAYIFSGIFVGAFGFFSDDTSKELLNFLASFGVAFLLF